MIVIDRFWCITLVDSSKILDAKQVIENKRFFVSTLHQSSIAIQKELGKFYTFLNHYLFYDN